MHFAFSYEQINVFLYASLRFYFPKRFSFYDFLYCSYFINCILSGRKQNMQLSCLRRNTLIVNINKVYQIISMTTVFFSLPSDWLVGMTTCVK